MLSSELLMLIDEFTCDNSTKVIYVGDDHQLAPVGEEVIPAFKIKCESAVLDQPMRQDPESHIFKQCDALRSAVRDKVKATPEAGEGVRFVSADEFKSEMVEAFKNGEDARAIAYTNAQVEGMNKYLRRELGKGEGFAVGDLVVCANAAKGQDLIANQQVMSTVEETHTITRMWDHDDYCYAVVLDDMYQFFIPKDKNQWFNNIKAEGAKAKKSKKWGAYFKLKEGYLDIRDASACTAHKSQGSTYDKVFIELANMNRCQDIDTYVRMVYVAVSRARKEAIIYTGK